MRLFVDSSDVVVWERFHRQGWVYGATTNPLILKKDGKTCTYDTYVELVKNAQHVGLKELQIQATGKTADELFASGEAIAALTKHIDIVIKVPLTRAGLAAGAQLIANQHRVTMTAAYAAHQMIAATAMGASYIAPYYGRLVEAGKDADGILSVMADIFCSSETAPRILIASIRSIAQLEGLCAQGFDTFTLSPAVAAELGQSEMSDTAASDFETARTG